MALLVGVGGRNSHAFEPVVTLMEASSRDAVVLFVNLGSRYHVCFWRACRPALHFKSFPRYSVPQGGHYENINCVYKPFSATEAANGTRVCTVRHFAIQTVGAAAEPRRACVHVAVSRFLSSGCCA